MRVNRIAANCRGGFTFIEVMVALGIIAIALVTVISTQSQSMVLIEKARDVSRMTELARSKMNSLLLEFKDKGMGELPEKDAGVFETEGDQQVKWAFEIRKIEIPGNAVTAAAEATDGGQQQSNVGMGLVADALAKSIRQMTFTVTWPVGKREQSLQLMTFLTSARELPRINGAVPGAAGGQQQQPQSGQNPAGGKAPQSAPQSSGPGDEE